MILFGGYAYGPALSPQQTQDALLGLVRAHWGLASRTLADMFIRGGDDAAQNAFARTTRAAASPEAAARRMAECFRTDVRSEVPGVTAPTLVLHRREDRNVLFEHGLALASGIPGAQFIPLDGQSHVWYVGDMDSVLSPILQFLGDKRRPPRSDTALSARERQVAALISHGFSNGEIATRLDISGRTAEAHVEHIRNKLGFRSRSQIAAWVADNLAEEIGTGA